MAERLLWNTLRSLPNYLNFRFRRQHPLHPYIADFACLKRKLIVELDGYSHDFSQKYDAFRDEHLRHLGYTVLRFSNDDVLNNLEGVVATILCQAKNCAETK